MSRTVPKDLDAKEGRKRGAVQSFKMSAVCICMVKGQLIGLIEDYID